MHRAKVTFTSILLIFLCAWLLQFTYYFLTYGYSPGSGRRELATLVLAFVSPFYTIYYLVKNMSMIVERDS